MSLTRVIVVATALLASTLSVYPHQLAYFNELAGGPENGHKHLLHSNLDWGQDLLLARTWMQEEAIPPEQVRVVSYFPYPASLSNSVNSGKTSNADWEIVSPDKVVDPDSDYFDTSLNGAAVRIGYTIWVFSQASHEKPAPFVSIRLL